MKKHKTAWMGLALVMAVALGLAWMACRDIPNDEDKMTLEISVDLLGIDEASFRDSDLKQVVMPASEMEGSKLIEPPEESKLHLKIKLTNPKEVFYVWNYNGKPVTITVASGTDRVIDVEGYLVYGYGGGGGELIGPVASYPSDMFPADHLMTVNPVSERTLDLSGEATTVKVEVDYDPYTGYINGGTVEGLEVDGEVQPLPVDYDCPPNMYMANLADRDWGLVFPSIALYMDTGGMYQVPYSEQQSVDPDLMPSTSFYIDNVPLKKNIGIHVWHYFAGFNKTLGVYTGSTVTKTDPFVFKGFQPNVVDVGFSPDTMDGVTTGYYKEVYIMANGRYGGYTIDRNIENDTCGGFAYGFYYGGEMLPQASMPGLSGMAVGVYEFNPYDDCTISVDVYSCDEQASSYGASASMQVTINEVCGDGYCNGSETESNCYEDCGAGYYYPYY